MKITLHSIDVGGRLDSDNVEMTVEYTIGDHPMMLQDKGRYNIRNNVYWPGIDTERPGFDGWDEYETLQETVEARG